MTPDQPTADATAVEALTANEREALHRFMHNGWTCQYASPDRCRRLREFEETYRTLAQARAGHAVREALDIDLREEALHPPDALNEQAKSGWFLGIARAQHILDVRAGRAGGAGT